MKTEWDCVDCGIHVIACIPQPDEVTQCATCQFIAGIEDPVTREEFRQHMASWQTATEEILTQAQRHPDA